MHMRLLLLVFGSKAVEHAIKVCLHPLFPPSYTCPLLPSRENHISEVATSAKLGSMKYCRKDRDSLDVVAIQFDPRIHSVTSSSHYMLEVLDPLDAHHSIFVR